MDSNDSHRHCNYCCGNHRCNLLNSYVIIAAITAYTLNTFVGKPNFSFQFLHGYLNDLFVMPLILAYTNLLFYWVGRRPPYFTTPIRIGFLTAFCAFIWEGLTPMLLLHSSRDLWDVIAYAVGGFGYFILISAAKRQNHISPIENA